MTKADQPGRALFPASFDPVTNGHLDLIHRARRIFPDLVVAVADNVAKRGLFTVEERLEMLRSALDELPGVEFGPQIFPYRLKRHGPYHTPLVREVAAKAAGEGC